MTFVRTAQEPDPTISTNQQLADMASMLNTNSNHPADAAIRKEQGQSPEDAATLRQARTSLDQAQTRGVDDKNALELVKQAEALDSAIFAAAARSGLAPTEWNISTELLRAKAKTNQQLDKTARAMGQPGIDLYDGEAGLAPPSLGQPQPQTQQPTAQQHPDTFPDGSTVHIKQNRDGTIQAKLVTGEIFKGDPITVTRQLGEAQVNTKRWGQSQRAAATQAQSEQPTISNGNGSQALVAQPAQQQEYVNIADWAAEQAAESFAKKAGYSNAAEMIADQTHRGQVVEEMETQLIMTNFLSRCQDFPCTDEAAAKLEGVVQRMGWDMGNVDHLAAAHAWALRTGLYQPAVEPTPITRPAAPPPPPSGGTVNADPRHAVNGVDPYQMPLDELRKAALGGGADPAYTTMIPAQRGPARG